jgi:hypothetical protein
MRELMDWTESDPVAAFDSIATVGSIGYVLTPFEDFDDGSTRTRLCNLFSRTKDSGLTRQKSARFFNHSA